MSSPATLLNASDSTAKFRQEKAHKHKLFCPVGLRISPDLSQGQTQFVPGTNPVKNWDKPRISFTQWKPGKPGFVPGTNPGLSLGQTRGRREEQRVYVKKVYVPFSLAKNDSMAEAHILH